MSSEPKKLVVIDGKSVFYRGYYAMPNLSTKDGTPTGGVYGFTALALEVIKRLKPDYVAVAWDKPKTNIRKRLELYPDYKAGRKPAPPDFYVQIPILHELLEALGWPLYELDDYEADDIMATLAKKAGDAGLQTLLVTSDLDALQSIDNNTKIYTLKNGLSNVELYSPESFKAKYNLDVHQFIDLKSLKGDSSDNIPGVPGIGEKTAVDLLNQYQTLDGIYENIALIKDSVRKKLEAGKDSAYLSKQIVTLFTDAPVPLDLESTDIHNFDRERLLATLTKLEFRSLIRQIPELAPDQQVQSTKAEGRSKDTASSHSEASDKISSSQSVILSEAEGSLFDLKIGKIVIIDTDKALKDIESFKETEELVIHSRCAGKHGRKPQLLIISPDPKTTFVLDLTKLDKTSVVDILNSKFQILHSKLLGYDIKSTLKILIELGFDELPVVGHDVQVGAFLVNSLRREQTLSDLALTDLGLNLESFEELDNEQLTLRAGELMAVVRGLATMQGEQISELTGVIKLAEHVEWPIIPVLAKMEYEGIKLNTSYLSKFNEQLSDTISDMQQTIYGYADQEFNIASPSQLADILFLKLNLPTVGIKKGKTGYSTAASELDKLRPLHPIIDCITNYRENTKLQNTYVEALPKMVDENSRVHTTFNLNVAPTGRLSSVDPNLQNIPVRTELGKHIRTAFIAEKGNVLVSADYSQFELRIAAVLSGDETMIQAFNEDRDIHTETAALVRGIDPKDVTKEMRYAAKAVNFGILYGQGVFGLSSGTGMSMAESKDFIQRYFEVRPKLKQYIEDTRKKAHDKGYVETLLGRRRPTPDVRSSNFVVREAAYRAAINMPVQGTAADLTKLAMIALDKDLSTKAEGRSKDVKMLLQIHDSILVECPESMGEEVGKKMKEVMEGIYPDLGIKLRVDVSIGKNWGEL